MSKTENRNIKLYIDGSEIPGTVKDIEKEIKKLQKAWKEMEVGSEEYNATAAKIKNLRGVLSEHKNSLRSIKKEQQSMLSKGVDLFNKYAASVMSVIAAITGLAIKLNDFRKLANEREEASADVKALTGLDDASVQWLEQTAIRLSTSMTSSGIRIRQSASEILDAYKLVGSAKPELLSNKEALASVTEQTLILASASGMKLSDAVDAVTLSMNQYGAAADQASRYTNVMAAGSKYGAAAVESVTKSIRNSGVAASSAGVTIEQLVGSIETLAEKGIKDEVAGTGLKKFFLTLQTGADDTNPKVVGLYQALDNLAAKGLTATEIKKQFGEEGYNVASVLINEADKVKSYTKAVTGSAVATEQAAIKSDTLAAKLSQAKNELNEQGILLARELNPAITQLLNGLVNWTRYGVEIIKWMNEHKTLLIPLISALASYYATIGLINVATLLWNNRMKASAAIVGSYKVAVALLHVTMVLFKQGLSAAKLEMTKLNTTIKANPVGLLLSVITTVIALIWQWKNASEELSEALTTEQRVQKDMDDINKSVSQSTASEISQIKILTSVIHDNTRSLNDRRAAITKLQQIIPGYTAEINNEGKVIKETTAKIDEHIKKLKEMAMAQAMTEKMTEIQSQRLDVETSNNRRKTALYKRKNRLSGLMASNPYLSDYQSQLDASAKNSASADWLNVAGISDFIANQNKSLDRDKVKKAVADYITYKRQINQASDWVQESTQQLQDLATRENVLTLTAKSLKIKLDSVIPDQNNTATSTNQLPASSDSDKEKDSDKQLKADLLKIEADYLEQKNKLKQQFRDGEISSQTDYEQQLVKLELNYLNRKLAVAGLEPKEREKIKEQILDKQLEIQQQIDDLLTVNDEKDTSSQILQTEQSYETIQEMIEFAYDNGIIPTVEAKEKALLTAKAQYEEQKRTIMQAAATQRLADLDSSEQAELLKIKEQYAKKLISAEEYELKKSLISQQYASQRLSVQGLTSQQSSELYSEYYDNLITETENKNKEMKSQYETMRDSMSQFTTSLGEVFGQWMTDSEFDFSAFSRRILTIALESLEKMIMIKYVEIAAGDIAKLSWAGLATAAAKYAAIKGLFAIAKGAVSNFYSGGFTPDGDWDQPQGVVHSNEFVANRYAVMNPAVRPVLNLIDNAQRSNSVSNLTSEDIAAVAGHPFYRQSEALSSPIKVSYSSDPELISIIKKLELTLQLATEAYQQPSPAYCWAEGKGGVNEAQSLISKLKNNAKRK